tara:strand:+ start:364 stop:888 length:525 start_codon:yes stop_codon:yes gene_type:complete
MYRKAHNTPSLINNNTIKGIRYEGPLQHLNCSKDIKPFTWCREPEFLFAIGAIVGLGALIIFRCIIHRSSIQSNTDYEFLKHQNPIIGSPEYAVISNVLVQRYGMDRYLKYKTLKVLKELGFIDIHPEVKKEKSPVVRIGEGVMRYQNILVNEELRNELRHKVKTLRKKDNVKG